MNVRFVIRLFSFVIKLHRHAWTGYASWDQQVFDSTWLINYSGPSAVDWFLDINNKGNARVIIHPFFLVTTVFQKHCLFCLGSGWICNVFTLSHTVFVFALSDYHPEEGRARIKFMGWKPMLCIPMATNSEPSLLE